MDAGKYIPCSCSSEVGSKLVTELCPQSHMFSHWAVCPGRRKGTEETAFLRLCWQFSNGACALCLHSTSFRARGQPLSRMATRALSLFAALRCSMSLRLEWNLSPGTVPHSSHVYVWVISVCTCLGNFHNLARVTPETQRLLKTQTHDDSVS